MTLVAVIGEPVHGRCRSCRALISFYTTWKKLKSIPFDRDAPIIKVETINDQEVRYLDAARNHFLSCPDADKWRKPR